jgi:bromodomain-containing protein 8
MASSQAEDNSWTIFEKLLLIQSVYKYGDNWLAISRTLKQHSMVSHTAEFFTQKNCATKYNTLVDPLKNEAEIEE